ncbi:MAG: hypothetical protein ACREX4_17565 [Gammaproteobacteria bacterium]
MDQRHVSTLAKQFKKTFSEQELNEARKANPLLSSGARHNPHRLAMGLIEVFANSKVETIADIHRAFNALCESNVQ